MCILDTAGKILERIVLNRLEEAVGVYFVDYHFRKGRSTIDTMNTVANIAQTEISDKPWKRGLTTAPQ